MVCRGWSWYFAKQEVPAGVKDGHRAVEVGKFWFWYIGVLRKSWLKGIPFTCKSRNGKRGFSWSIKRCLAIVLIIQDWEALYSIWRKWFRGLVLLLLDQRQEMGWESSVVFKILEVLDGLFYIVQYIQDTYLGSV